jgi:hypothetical protein
MLVLVSMELPSADFPVPSALLLFSRRKCGKTKRFPQAVPEPETDRYDASEEKAGSNRAFALKHFSRRVQVVFGACAHIGHWGAVRFAAFLPGPGAQPDPPGAPVVWARAETIFQMRSGSLTPGGDDLFDGPASSLFRRIRRLAASYEHKTSFVIRLAEKAESAQAIVDLASASVYTWFTD